MKQLKLSLLVVSRNDYDGSIQKHTNLSTGKAITKTLWDPKEIYLQLKKTIEEKYQQELKEKVRREQEDKDYRNWYYNRQAEIASATTRGEIAPISNYRIAIPDEHKP